MAAWLAARSLSRDLPAPVFEAGGVRVDTGLPDERRRYVFAKPCEGLRELGRTIVEPFVPLKLCRPAAELLALLPSHWVISSNSWVMGRDGAGTGPSPMPAGYTLGIDQAGPVWSARITDAAGALAASGHAIEHDGVFIYDRIRTEPAHERRGLGRALMAALAGCRRDPASREILTATAPGRALYLQLGWHDLAPYSTAVIPEISPP
ncbi:GNAT family N-acetyltransferase [Sphingomonas sp. BIUV-7]|uniref:GNAT family N-acetyltransferase n=1 Tax=Sphingomonas natans TaxID=3063330 RepID=A0ABT8Y565_9SPHN|nr:GNAT family N-acetyltransferase [Sphingomonas sp. BIUV-7]MDO6413470.1 GNAT family N-acetyltransferase [Sphingomonas sp. BIUV-7]